MKVYIPSDFYYTQEVEGKLYSRKPPGRLDPNRAVKGKSDYWLSPRPAISKKNKTVIITDWTLSHSKDLFGSKIKKF